MLAHITWLDFGVVALAFTLGALAGGFLVLRGLASRPAGETALRRIRPWRRG